MNTLSLIALLLGVVSCSKYKELNEKIYQIQKAQLLKSSYNDANRRLSNIAAQRELRLKQLPKLVKDIIYNPDLTKDTILLVEEYYENCGICPSYLTQVLYKDTVYTLDEKMVDNKAHYSFCRQAINRTSTDRAYQSEHDVLLELDSKMRRNENWTENPQQYGDNCIGGARTMITAIYGDKTIEAMYVSCWNSFFYRQEK